MFYHFSTLNWTISTVILTAFFHHWLIVEPFRCHGYPLPNHFILTEQLSNHFGTTIEPWTIFNGYLTIVSPCLDTFKPPWSYYFWLLATSSQLLWISIYRCGSRAAAVRSNDKARTYQVVRMFANFWDGNEPAPQISSINGQPSLTIIIHYN